MDALTSRARRSTARLRCALASTPARAATLGLALSLTLPLSACLPNVEIDEATVRAPKVLAVRAVPAEAAPGDTITWEAVVGAPNGVALAEPGWSRCDARRPLAELGPVARACFDDEAARTALGEGLAITTALPRNSCSLFGPNPPPAKPGEAGGRPVDADRTGGYYHPFVVALGAARDAAFARVFCGLAGATQAESVRYATEYRRNTNPIVASIAVVRGGVATELGEDPPLAITAGETLELEVRWPPESVERYLRRGDEGALTETSESLRASFFVTGGAVADPRVGATAANAARTAYEAPAEPGEVRVWAVLRDERGGVGWLDRRVRVVTR
jgi:hypothetical protein